MVVWLCSIHFPLLVTIIFLCTPCNLSNQSSEIGGIFFYFKICVLIFKMDYISSHISLYYYRKKLLSQFKTLYFNIRDRVVYFSIQLYIGFLSTENWVLKGKHLGHKIEILL